MKKEELLKEINKLPDGVVVQIFDFIKNINGDTDGEDGHIEGLYSDFEVGMMGKNEVKGSPWAYLSFECHDDGGRYVEQLMDALEKATNLIKRHPDYTIGSDFSFAVRIAEDLIEKVDNAVNLEDDKKRKIIMH